jgi:hypothetical protein
MKAIFTSAEAGKARQEITKPTPTTLHAHPLMTPSSFFRCGPTCQWTLV